ncbi:MAG: ATP-binding protein [Pseudomonadota bacterium]|nr:ATP-binding protein [Pseudomonadota bacterium]
MTRELKFHIELNVLNHLGIGLYSSTPAVVTEIISNAWDADASEVKIEVRPEDDLILVEDNGHGMTFDDVSGKFLKVGYSRRTREANGDRSRSGERRVMGRKGIGKLAMFSLADQIDIVTRAENSDVVAFRIDVLKLRDQANRANDAADIPLDYPVEEIDVPADFSATHGTRISLRKLNTRINRTADFLRPRLARRFGVFGNTFKVMLNGSPVTRRDAGFYGDFQFLWHFDDAARDDVLALAPNLAKFTDETTGEEKTCIEAINALILGAPPGLTVRGVIATVDLPAKLGKGDESLNRISVFANGRLFQEDILSELGDARLFNSYLVGEVHADFLDQDGIDRATASREAIKHDDEEFQALRRHLRTTLTHIRDRWDEWRNALGYSNAPEKNPDIETWIASFADKHDRRAADRLMTSISKLNLSNNDENDRQAKRLLYKSAVVGFEKLRARHQLDALENITDVLSPEFQAIFTALDDLEESYYLDIVRSRLEVIRKFEEEIVDAKKQERVAQKYLFDHLWLLDPSWDRVTGSEQWEVTLTDELKRACPDEEEGARLDIAYRTTAGRHVIIELKKPGLYVAAKKLEEQGRRYVDAMEQFYREHPDFNGMQGKSPIIDVFFLVDRAPDINEKLARSFEVFNLKFLTYTGLIGNAKMAYQSYLDVKNKVGRIAAVLDKL